MGKRMPERQATEASSDKEREREREGGEGEKMKYEKMIQRSSRLSQRT